MLEVDKTRPLAYIVAEDNEIRLEEPPALGARGVVKF